MTRLTVKARGAAGGVALAVSGLAATPAAADLYETHCQDHGRPPVSFAVIVDTTRKTSVLLRYANSAATKPASSDARMISLQVLSVRSQWPMLHYLLRNNETGAVFEVNYIDHDYNVSPPPGDRRQAIQESVDFGQGTSAISDICGDGE